MIKMVLLIKAAEILKYDVQRRNSVKIHLRATCQRMA